MAIVSKDGIKIEAEKQLASEWTFKKFAVPC